MNTLIPFFKLLGAYFLGGFAGGYVYGILSTHSLTISFLYSLIGAVSLTLAIASTYYLRKKIIKSFIFGIVSGLSISCLSFYLLNPNKSFLEFTIPLTFGCTFGGSIYIYLSNVLSKNQIKSVPEKP